MVDEPTAAPEAATLLVVDDDAPQRTTLAGFFRKRRHRVLEAASAAEAELAAQQHDVDLVLTDLRLGGPDGVALLIAIKQRRPDVQAIVLTAYGTVDDAVRAMRAGAYDFVAKPVDLERLAALVDKAIERVQLARENRGLRTAVALGGAFDELVGASAALQRVKELALRVAPTRANVLILGESGTGKELLARALHLASPRRTRPFVAVNCAALPETLIESELFGHEKGAFTGAAAARQGRFELADGGTIFLDEVGDIPLPLQVKLLRVLQSGSFERVGGNHARQVDVRLIAATHRDLDERIRAGLFREDLYYRLNVVALTLPPLRERPEDIPLLVEHLLRKHADLGGQTLSSIDPELLGALQRYLFPGNVRQLENWIERAVVLAAGPVLTAEDFPPALFEPAVATPPPASASAGSGDLETQVAALEIQMIRSALGRHSGNKSAAARDLGLTERAIRYKIAKYRL
ncbi:MAG: sigma-54-dependent Fis family transcriptional regulator [Deltaproteobacteria bacterium]|nr:sigma-54-dependent Fis family transcriptional regulator [Deltaproteobacteria bacterium]